MASTSSSSTPPRQHNELGNAFDQIAPPLSSSTFTDLPVDVFINHRGMDVKHTLATAIYNTLNAMGLRVFLDKEELEAGDVIPIQLQHAMQSASLHIAIFSPNYAHSRWCLAELSFMLKTGTRIIPVFYHVNPSDLRRASQGKGIYTSAFSQHEEKASYTSEKLEEWKRALEDVSFHSGYTLDNIDDEGGVLKSIVNSVLKAMKKVPLQEVAKHPVGLDDAVRDFESTVESARREQNVQIVGIVGMGGSGKTTLAKQLYNKNRPSFYSSSFLFDVRDAAARHNFLGMQKKLVKDLDGKDLQFDNIEEGKGILVSRLRCLQVLIVLDDVDHEDQLDGLLPANNSLGSGSLIIVTSRDIGVLTKWGISCIFKMRNMNRSHAKQLFCWHAFLKSHPVHEFEDLVEKFLNPCRGLPLSLKVFGGLVYGKPLSYWESQLHKISRILPEDIRGRLKISYDALDDEEKEMFMDVACFFIGERSSLAIEFWDGCGWSGQHGLETLVNKCVVDLDQKNRIRMHDHLRDLGRDLAKAHSPSRVWLPEQIVNFHRQAGERMSIRGINAAGFDYAGESLQHQQSLQRARRFMRPRVTSSLGLKLFIGRKENFAEGFCTGQSEDLVWLRWLDSESTKLPSWLSMGALRILELEETENLEELWADSHPPLQLRELTITDGFRLQKFPASIERLEHLKMIIAFDTPMNNLPKEFCGLKSLEHLELSGCQKLYSLPRHFGGLTNLQHIDLSGCRNLQMLPASFKQLIHLEYLDLSDCFELELRLDIMENMTKLVHLSFYGCRKLEKLPYQITNQASLRVLDVDDTSLMNVPTNIGQLRKLEVLKIGSPFLASLPSSLQNMSSLTCLKIIACENMESLPDSLGCLNMLEVLEIWDSGVKSLANVFGQVSDLGVGSCSSLCKLKRVEISGTQVQSISISEGCCSSLATLRLHENDHLTDIKTLPTSVKTINVRKCKMLKKIGGISGLVNLQNLTIRECPELEELPSFADLSSIQNIRIEGCDKVEKIESLQHWRSLKSRSIQSIGGD